MKRETRNQKLETGNRKLGGEEVGVLDRSQIHRNKEASERQPHPFCLNRRKGRATQRRLGGSRVGHPPASSKLRIQHAP
jgi:hypothetical protein